MKKTRAQITADSVARAKARGISEMKVRAPERDRKKVHAYCAKLRAKWDKESQP